MESVLVGTKYTYTTESTRIAVATKHCRRRRSHGSSCFEKVAGFPRHSRRPGTARSVSRRSAEKEPRRIRRSRDRATQCRDESRRRRSAARRSQDPGPGAARSAARRHLAESAALYALAPSDIAAARLAYVHNTGRGVVIAKFRQELDGVEVFRYELSVAMDRQLRVIAFSGYLAGSSLLAPGARTADLTIEEAVASALSDFARSPLAAHALPSRRRPPTT